MWKAMGKLALIGLLASVGACDAERNTGPDSSFRILEETLRLRPGSSGQLTIEGVTAAKLTFRSRQPEVVTVNGDGRVQAAAAGITWVIAESGAAVDSVRVVVSLTDTPESGIAFHVASIAETLTLTGVSRIMQPMFDGAPWTQITAAVDANQPAELQLSDLFDGHETMLIAQLRGVATPGFRTITPWTMQADEEDRMRLIGSEGALVWVRDPVDRSRVHIYVPVGPLQLEIDASEVPLESGPATGSLVGRMSFEAAGLIVQIDENGTRIVGQVAQETTNVYAEFSLAQRIQPLGGVRARISGGPTPFEPTWIGSPQAALWQGGLLLHAGGVVRNRYAIHAQLWAGPAALGDIAVGAVTIEELAAESAHTPTRTFMWLESGEIDDLMAGAAFENVALSTSGTLQITRYDAPGATTWGALEATLTTRQALILGGAPDAVQDVTLEIVAPIAPTDRYAFPHPPTTLTNTDRIRIGPGVIHVSNGVNDITGVVIETGETPVADVPIELAWGDRTLSVRTDEYGRFTFAGVTPADYEVRITVPEGYQLADGQRAVIGPLNVTGETDYTLPIAFADAEGNGALRIFAISDGVTAHVRAEGSPTVIATLVTGELHHASGTVSRKLPPGRYEVDLVPPPGYILAEGQSSTVTVDIRSGHTRAITVTIVRP